MRIKYTFVTIIALIMFSAGNIFSQASADEDTEKKINELLSKMTLEEKVGQMTQITLEVVMPPRKEGEPLVIDEEKLRKAIIDHKVGSIINTGGWANTPEEWHDLINMIHDITENDARLNIPVLYGIDAIHGANYTQGATLFPQALNMAAARNRDLVRKSGEITAYEVSASGIKWNFYPVLGMGREPLWPRMWETFGEDVYLTSEMGKAYVEGQQGDDLKKKENIAVCLKHYIGYSVPLNGRDRTPAWIPERMLREIFLPPFEEGVEAGGITVMVNSAEINGIPTHSDYHLLTEVLKEELGFSGFIVSDWEDIKRLHTRDKVADTPEEAVKMAVNAGMDMSMVPYDYTFSGHLINLVNKGEVSESRIDDAVRRILRVKYALGLFDDPRPDKSMIDKIGSEEFTKVNLEAARESITLLKNKEDVLPLNKDMRVLVTGPTADLLSVLNGGWTITWQGNNEDLYPQEKLTVLEAVKEKAGEENVVYVPGATVDTEESFEDAVNAAADVDAVVLCLGEMPYCESPGNINDLELPEAQIKLAQKLYETGKPVILVMIEGRPRLIRKIADDAAGIIMAYLPGMEGGIAISDVLFGDYNPSGKLPFSYPKHPHGSTTYDHKPMEDFDVNKYDVQYPFGYGLSYTTFEYAELNVDKEEVTTEDIINVTVDVTNTGEMAGKEAVELYLTDQYGSVSRPVKQLKGFEKIYLEPGETKTVSFELDKDDLSFIGRGMKRITEPGGFTVTISNLSNEFKLK